MTHWSFIITNTEAGYDWTVHRGSRLHAHGTAGDYETAWLDSHDSIPGVTTLADRRIPVTESTPVLVGPVLH